MAGVAPVRHNFEDVAGPVVDGNECACGQVGPDGFTDLILKFKTQHVAESLLNLLGVIEPGEVLELLLTGVLTNEGLIEGNDGVVIVGKVSASLAAKRADIFTDGIVDMLDFAVLSGSWLERAEVE